MTACGDCPEDAPPDDEMTLEGLRCNRNAAPLLVALFTHPFDLSRL